MDMEQMVEQRAKANAVVLWPAMRWESSNVVLKDNLRALARAELEREGRLVHTIKRDIEAFRCSGQPINQERAEHCVARYEAEFAPPTRTVEQIARDVVSKHTFEDGGRFIAVPVSLMDELAAALGKDGK